MQEILMFLNSITLLIPLLSVIWIYQSKRKLTSPPLLFSIITLVFATVIFINHIYINVCNVYVLSINLLVIGTSLMNLFYSSYHTVGVVVDRRLSQEFFKGVDQRKHHEKPLKEYIQKG